MTKLLLSLLLASASVVFAQSVDVDVSLPVTEVPSADAVVLHLQGNVYLTTLPGEFDLWAQPVVRFNGLDFSGLEPSARLLLDGPLYTLYLACGVQNSSPGCRVGVKFGVP